MRTDLAHLILDKNTRKRETSAFAKVSRFLDCLSDYYSLLFLLPFILSPPAAYTAAWQHKRIFPSHSKAPLLRHAQRIRSYRGAVLIRPCQNPDAGLFRILYNFPVPVRYQCTHRSHRGCIRGHIFSGLRAPGG